MTDRISSIYRIHKDLVYLQCSPRSWFLVICIFYTITSILVKDFLSTNYYPLLIFFYLGHWKRYLQMYFATHFKLWSCKTWKTGITKWVFEKSVYLCRNLIIACEPWHIFLRETILMPLLATYDFTCRDEVIETMALNWRIVL